MAVRLAFYNGKGGCGKSTGVFNVAGVLSRQGKHVLVIDLDKQKNTTNRLLMNTDRRPDYSVLDVMLGKCAPADAVGRARFQTRGNAAPKYFGVDCMAAEAGLSNPRALEDFDRPAFSRAIRAYIDAQKYDWVLIDMPPSNLYINDLCLQYLATHVICPFSSDMDSVDGCGDIVESIEQARAVNPELEMLGVYLSRYSRTSVDLLVKQRLEALGDLFLDVQIPNASDIRESAILGRPISYYRVVSESKTAYRQLTRTIQQLVGDHTATEAGKNE